jgi:hypothetical protein
MRVPPPPSAASAVAAIGSDDATRVTAAAFFSRRRARANKPYARPCADRPMPNGYRTAPLAPRDRGNVKLCKRLSMNE